MYHILKGPLKERKGRQKVIKLSPTDYDIGSAWVFCGFKGMCFFFVLSTTPNDMEEEFRKRKWDRMNDKFRAENQFSVLSKSFTIIHVRIFRIVKIDYLILKYTAKPNVLINSDYNWPYLFSRYILLIS